MAKEFMDQGVASFQIADPMRGEQAPTQDEVECQEATRPSALISPGLESNPDSCYDSDSSSVGSNCNGTADADEHDNISRTTSDTLAAERSESDTPKMDVVSAARPAVISSDINPNINTSIMDDDDDDDDDDDVEPGGGKPPTEFVSNVEYAAKVEFGLRLGYTEDQIFRALDKVGYKISEDELLAELIKISDLTERSDDSDDSVSDVNVGLDRVRIGDVDNDPEELRPIVVDGSNVAMSHGNNIVFSCAGIKLAVDWFRERGHREITVFVPTWRKEASCSVTPITEQDILLDLEKDKVVVFTPARRVAGKRVVCYDDRYIIKLAAENGGIVVSNDNYRDLIDENPDYKKVVDERLLMYSFVNDRFMPPDDPLGRYGPSLTDFLRRYPASSRSLPPACPYGKKCTYGNKCKYYHPERGQQPVKLINEKLIEKACKKIKEVKEKGHLSSAEKKTKRNVEKSVKKLPLMRTKSQTPAPQKKALTHTRSLQPNHSSVQSKPKSSSDFMQPESGGKFNKETKDTVVKISVTTEFDSDNYHRYNNKLSELRQKVHDAEALGSSCQTSGEAVRRQDGDWMKDVVKEKRPLSSWAVPHKDLHPEFGDPQASFANGHLALAKKLSDEGNSGDNHRHNTGIHCLSPRKARQDVGSKLVQSQGQPPVRGHMTLQRQLSLKGSDDPRLSHGLGADYHGMSMVQQGEENQQCAPSAQAGQSHWSRQGHNLLAKRASCPLVTVPARSRDCSPRPGVLSQCIPQHPQLTDYYMNHVYDNNVTSSCDQNSLAAQQPMAEHLPLHRLKSDPLIPQNSARAHGLVTKFTEMSRQNSTSDPQLSSHQEEPDWGCSTDMAPGSNTNDLFMGIPRESVLGIPLHIRTAPNSPHILMSPHLGQKSFPFKHSVGTLHLKESHGSYPDVYASTSLSQVLQCSASNLQSGVGAQSIASYHMGKPLPSEVNGNSGFFLSGQSKPPQMMIPGLVQDHSKPSVVFSQPAYQPSVSQHVVAQIPPQMSTAVQQQHALIGTNGPVPMIVRDGAVTQTMNLTTRAPQSCASGVTRDMSWPSSQVDPCIGQTDARHKLYYHLCALFNEEQVKRVMSEHPNETNPQVLCKYLISR